MPVESIVINTGPLILLEKAGALEIVGRLPFQFVCPTAVRLELDAGKAKGFSTVDVPWLTTIPLKAPLSPLVQATLDQGEAEVIQLALEQGFQRVCLDDLRGRRIAMAAGLRVTGVLGLLVLAKTERLIPAIKPFCDRLVQSGAWYTPALVKRVLAGVGE